MLNALLYLYLESETQGFEYAGVSWSNSGVTVAWKGGRDVDSSSSIRVRNLHQVPKPSSEYGDIFGGPDFFAASNRLAVLACIQGAHKGLLIVDRVTRRHKFVETQAAYLAFFDAKMPRLAAIQEYKSFSNAEWDNVFTTLYVESGKQIRVKRIPHLWATSLAGGLLTGIHHDGRNVAMAPNGRISAMKVIDDRSDLEVFSKGKRSLVFGRSTHLGEWPMVGKIGTSDFSFDRTSGFLLEGQEEVNIIQGESLRDPENPNDTLCRDIVFKRGEGAVLNIYRSQYVPYSGRSIRGGVLRFMLTCKFMLGNKFYQPGAYAVALNSGLIRRIADVPLSGREKWQWVIVQ